MTEGVEPDAAKANLANLTKIPASEFETHFHEWMERDDVARELQAKLRCDLIKNFNKTNLGKQLMAHTMTATGYSTYRLSLTPLVLALNTLVAEFLYAQNCHFTLSVFCTEVPFRNTLPDFECMRHFRFSEREICEIWEAVNNSAPNKRSLDPTIVEDYESNSNSSLLLLFLKCLVNQKPQEMLCKSIEVQTETPKASQTIYQCSTSVQVSPPSPVKTQAKAPDNIRHLNKYLLILAQKVNEMTREFELLVRQRNLSKPSTTSGKSVRSRELHSLNRSLERINENVKQLSKSKSSRSKRLTNVVESIESLTKQFAKCSENFDQVTRELYKKRENVSTGQQANLDEAAKEPSKPMEMGEKSYVDWITEMRTTNNGRKFLERIEKSLQKANKKYREQLDAESHVKMKQMKTVLKTHYKQKMILRLSRQCSDEQHKAEAQKLNEEMEMKLKQFEMKQTELVQQLKDSSFELQEAQKRVERDNDNNKDKQNQGQSMSNDKKQSTAAVHQKMEITVLPTKIKHSSRKLPEAAQYHFAPTENDVEKIINETKQRLRHLESESNFLEHNFLTCLESRKQQRFAQQESALKLISESRRKTSEILENLKTNRPICKEESMRSPQPNLWPKPVDLNVDDDEFLTITETVQKPQQELSTLRSLSSSSPTEMANVILNAKDKFFENESLKRKQNEEELFRNRFLFEENIHFPNGFDQVEYDFQKELEDDGGVNQVSYELSSYSWNLVVPGNQRVIESPLDARKFQSEDLKFKIGLKKKSLEKGPVSFKPSGNPSNRMSLSQKSTALESFENDASTSCTAHCDQLSSPKQTLTQALDDLKCYTEHLQLKKESTSDLIKQSMAKMNQLFEDSEKSNQSKVITFIEDLQRRHQDEQQQLHEQQLNLDARNITSTSTNANCNTKVTSTGVYCLGPVGVSTKSTTDILKPVAFSVTNLAEKENSPTNDGLELNSHVNTPTAGSLMGKGIVFGESLKAALLTGRLSATSMPTLLNATSSESDEESIKSMANNKFISGNVDEVDENCKVVAGQEPDDGDELDDEYDDDDGEKSQSDEELLSCRYMPKLMLSAKGTGLEVGKVGDVLQSQFVSVPVADTTSTSDSSSSTIDPETDVSVSRREEKLSKLKSSEDSDSDFWTKN